MLTMMELARKLVEDVKNGKIDEASALQRIRAEAEVAKFNIEMESKYGHCCAPIPPNAEPEKSDVERALEEIQERHEDMEKKIENAEDFVAYFRRRSGY